MRGCVWPMSQDSTCRREFRRVTGDEVWSNSAPPGLEITCSSAISPCMVLDIAESAAGSTPMPSRSIAASTGVRAGQFVADAEACAVARLQRVQQWFESLQIIGTFSEQFQRGLNSNGARLLTVGRVAPSSAGARRNTASQNRARRGLPLQARSRIFGSCTILGRLTGCGKELAQHGEHLVAFQSVTRNEPLRPAAKFPGSSEACGEILPDSRSPAV